MKGAASVCGGCGIPYGISIDFRLESLPEAAFVKKAVIDAHQSKHESIASGGFIVPQDRSFLKPRRSGKSGTSQIVSFEHAKASAALAASFKRACGKSRLVTATWRLSGRITVATGTRPTGIYTVDISNCQMGYLACLTRVVGNSRGLQGSCKTFAPRAVAAQGYSMVRLTD